MSSFDPSPETNPAPKPPSAGNNEPAAAPARVGTIVWGLVVLALAVLITVSQLGIVVLNGTYVLIGLMIGAGAALVIGGLLAARKRDNSTTNGKS
ncbi:hypothetical protein [Arthrobacter globiformis]|uniref:Uncharacterized protein n=1 Tax=Arthrobacter globiformis TaxID=1665 RepID=A0A328HBW0_ARTGO|nr:hypothetical protein [Arthrobacter globiformis]RAM35999.1 hypothetical protein DBZ45_17780 [Arthrobacter globiformis]